ncbi:MAG: microcin C transport system permease protein [Rhodospirillaceae bacterium]|nr:MAG: microcin C transport system permease protein [Rhodospirillaceae bacterium]
MGPYIFRRMAFIPLTLFGILLINFAIVQIAPGGPVEQVLSRLKGSNAEATGRLSGAGAQDSPTSFSASALSERTFNSKYSGAQGLDLDLIKALEQQFGFDKPTHERFFLMMRNYLTFDLGNSYYRDKSVLSLVWEKLPVSISLGLWSTVIIYMVSVPLGIAKAVRDGSRFDVVTSSILVTSYAIPGFLFAILLIVLFAGGRYLDWFPLRGLTSDNWLTLSWPERIGDYLWHMTLPVTAITIGGFATLTLLTKNAFLDEIGKHYVTTARAKGLTERRVLYGHVFRNAMLLIIAGFPRTLVGILFTGSLLIEVVFTLDGLGLLGFEAARYRDYPVVFGTLYFFSLTGLLLNIVSDITLHLIDPRIDFERRGA